MRRRKGFVFIETLIVIAVLTVSLLVVYSSYQTAISKEKYRLRYNDAAYLYRTYYITKFFKNLRLDILANNLNNDSSKGTLNIMTGFNCQNTSIFGAQKNNVGLCENLLMNYHVRNIYLSYNDLSFLQDDSNTSLKDQVLNSVNTDTARFLKTIGGAGSTGYRIIVEFSENSDGSMCNDDNCVFNYTTLSLGEIS
jgi:Tfp pilus assembly protein PilE